MTSIASAPSALDGRQKENQAPPVTTHKPTLSLSTSDYSGNDARHSEYGGYSLDTHYLQGDEDNYTNDDIEYNTPIQDNPPRPPQHHFSNSTEFVHDHTRDRAPTVDTPLHSQVGSPARNPTKPKYATSAESTLVQDMPSLAHSHKLSSMTNGAASLSKGSNPQSLKRNDSQKPKTGFFGWRTGTNSRADSTTAAFPEEQVVSPEHMTEPGHVPGEAASYYNMSMYGGLPGQGATRDLSHIDDLLQELREVSMELSDSIRREIELEDEVERVKVDAPFVPELSRRTSDYYSDSGASSTPLPALDRGSKIEALDKMRRKAEQEKAHLRLELSQKAQDDLNQRRALELHVQSLEAQLRSKAAEQADGQRVKGLEATLEDTKRRLNEERQFKENFEDLLSGMRQEVEAYRNERDNLKDEVVPQLRARLDGLESQATEVQKLQYDLSRVQQENQSLRNENQTLVNARRLQLDVQQSGARFKSIPEEDGGNTKSPSLSRSGSLVRTRSRRMSNPHVLRKDAQPVEITSESYRDLEDQRDALHRTLKSLILLQETMARNHKKQIRSMEKERDKALSDSHRRLLVNSEVHRLRSELDGLRRRADDAMEQKWQCQKGLSGLKMDLDRAQQETGSLRQLLIDNDSGLQASDDDETLDKVYSQLRNVHADSIARLSAAGTPDHEAAGQRITTLSRQIEDQLSTNAGLRDRLAEAIERGVLEQQASADKIAGLETALRAAEDGVVVATSASEEGFARHEDFVKTMRDVEHEHSRRNITRSSWEHDVTKLRLQGLGLGIESGNAAVSDGLRTPRTPLFAQRSPRIDRTTSGKTLAAPSETLGTEQLETRVAELERAAVQAEGSMQLVVAKMQAAQIQVASLTAERDENIKATRKLLREADAEQARLRTLAGF